MATSLTEKKYKESQKVKDAFDSYLSYKDNNAPGEYSFSDSDLLAKTQEQLFNHPEFSYSLSDDPVYRQYEKSYKEAGKAAMEDTMGNAAALTGGYGSSYAQTAGNQAYSSYLDKLGEIAPALYEAAYGRYSDGLDRLESRLGYLTDKNKDEYDRYLDRFNAYTDEVNALRQLYLKEYENDIEIQDSEWEAAYKLAMKEQERELANAEIGYRYYAANLAQQQFDQELALKQAQAEADNKYREQELRIERQKEVNDNRQWWTQYTDEHRETVSQSDINVLYHNGDYYNALAALDQNYKDDDTVRFRALAMGIDKDYIDSYFDAKY